MCSRIVSLWSPKKNSNQYDIQTRMESLLRRCNSKWRLVSETRLLASLSPRTKTNGNGLPQSGQEFKGRRRLCWLERTSALRLIGPTYIHRIYRTNKILRKFVRKMVCTVLMTEARMGRTGESRNEESIRRDNDCQDINQESGGKPAKKAKGKGHTRGKILLHWRQGDAREKLKNKKGERRRGRK